MIISHNMAAMNANRQYKINTGNTAKDAEKLASGYKINRAADDAAGLSISEKMRYQIKGLNQGTRNIGDGISYVNVAEGALNEVHSMLQRKRELLVQARNDTNTDADRNAIEAEMLELDKEVDRIFDTTSFNTRLIFRGHETITNGPVSTDVTPAPPANTTNTVTTTQRLWLNAAPDPLTGSESKTTSATLIYNGTNYQEVQTGDNTFDVTMTEDNYTVQKDTTVTESFEYKPVPMVDALTLKDPAVMTGSNGYINVQTKEGNLSLSCAMTRLDVKIDGGAAINSLYSKTSSQTIDADGSVTNTWNLSNVEVQQKISRSGNDTYSISYWARSLDGNTHSLDLKMVFDVLNNNKGDGVQKQVNDGSKSFTIESKEAKVTTSVTDGIATSRSVLGDTNRLYETWNLDITADGATLPNHTAVSTIFSTTSVASSTNRLGTVTYKVDNVNLLPYDLEKKTKTDVVYTQNGDATKTEYTYERGTMIIQCSSVPEDQLKIVEYDLTVNKLGIRSPGSVSAFDAETGIDKMSTAIDRISTIRSYYGAMTNRMEHALYANMNTSENTQVSESGIRDTDMAKAMVDKSKDDILQSATEAMLSQANLSTQGVLALLQ